MLINRLIQLIDQDILGRGPNCSARAARAVWWQILGALGLHTCMETHFSLCARRGAHALILPSSHDPWRDLIQLERRHLGTVLLHSSFDHELRARRGRIDRSHRQAKI